jgi:hypothetical protein
MGAARLSPRPPGCEVNFATLPIRRMPIGKVAEPNCLGESPLIGDPPRWAGCAEWFGKYGEWLTPNRSAAISRPPNSEEPNPLATKNHVDIDDVGRGATPVSLQSGAAIATKLPAPLTQTR